MDRLASGFGGSLSSTRLPAPDNTKLPEGQGAPLRYDTADGPRSREITGGVAQGSILGPDLWNAFYDGILWMEMPNDTFLVAYADDVAAVITARAVSYTHLDVYKRQGYCVP